MMERHFEIWGGLNDMDDGGSDEFLETVIGPACTALDEAINITKQFHAQGYYAYIRDMDNDGSHVMFA
jgi:hypothetical protein